MKRKLVSILAVLALCLGLMPGTAWALEGDGQLEDKSGGWVELSHKNLPKEETVYKAGSGTLKWTPVLADDGFPASGTVTLTNATITAETGGIVLPLSFTLVLEGNNTITTTEEGQYDDPTGANCGVLSRINPDRTPSLTIKGPGSLTVNAARWGIHTSQNGTLTIQDGADVTVTSNSIQAGVRSDEGDIIVKDSKLSITERGSGYGLHANMGDVSIENSQVYVKSEGAQAIGGKKGAFKNSQVAAIAKQNQNYSGVIHFSKSFQVDGGWFYVENAGSSTFDLDYFLLPSVSEISAVNSAVICYHGSNSHSIQRGDNIQYEQCTYDKDTHTVNHIQAGYVCGNVVWSDTTLSPPDYMVRMYIMSYNNNAWVYPAATVTIPSGVEAEIAALTLPYSGGKLTVNGTLTSTIGICNYAGTIEGSGTLNAVVQTRETGTNPTYHDTFTAHGAATFRGSFTKIGTVSTTSAQGTTTTTKNEIVIPQGTSLTIPAGNTLDATVNGITVDNLSEYYTNNGTLIVNGTAKFPAGTDLSSLGTVTGTGQVIIGNSTAYPVTVTGGTADKTFAKAGETVTLTPEEETGKTFKGWTVTSGGVTVGEDNTFTMLGQAVTVTAQYDYTVTFDSQGGSAVESQTVESGGKATTPTAAPTKTGHTFGGWYTDAACTTAYDFNSTVTAPLTLYAKWTPIKCTVTFDLDPEGGPHTVSWQVDYGTKVKPFDPKREGYSLVGWYKEADCTTAWDFGSDTVTEDVTLYAKWTVQSTPSGGSGTPSPSLPVTTTGQNNANVTTTTTAAPGAVTTGNTATTAVNSSIGSEIVKQAVNNKSENVVIAPQVTGDVTKTEVSIPAATAEQIGSKTEASLTVSTPVAGVTIPNEALSSLAREGGSVTVTAEVKGTTVELSVTAGGETVRDIPGGITVTVPVTDTTPGTVAVLVHEDETREVVRKSVADGDSVTIPLDGSVKLEIVDNSKSFDDVPEDSWEADAVAFASARELFNGTAPRQFSPEAPMTRGMLTAVLHNLENNPERAVTDTFHDVDDDQWYAESVAWAVSEGIVSGYGNGMFGPDDNITREQLALMLWRCAGSPAAAGSTLAFTDADAVSEYALEALRWAVENGIVNGRDGGVLDPQGQATRAETAAMVMRYLTL